MTKLAEDVFDTLRKHHVRIERWGRKTPGRPPKHECGWFFCGWFYWMQSGNRVIDGTTYGPFPCMSAAAADAYTRYVAVTQPRRRRK
jgi:hypothetical protein